MSCIPCTEESSTIPIEDIDRWTDSLRQVLENKNGRKYFKEFLISREFEESEATLEFWERSEDLLKSDTHAPHKPSSHHKHASIEKLRFLKSAKDLVAFAEDRVDFDLAQLRLLYEAVDSGKEDKIKAVFNQAMQSAAENLEQHYELFRKDLLKRKGLVPRK
uniref:RGS domain-containing protein n=1 Tax=Clastoptera arizonana TaxID=38151 RepID=A0A1B6BWZ5_9HEMI